MFFRQPVLLNLLETEIQIEIKVILKLHVTCASVVLGFVMLVLQETGAQIL